MASALPRFTGPAQVRQRMRLAAALGILAIAAIATGGLASLTSGRPVREPKVEPTRTNAAEPELPHMLDPANLVEDRVEEAEQAMSRARAAIRSARQLGVVDGRYLDELEQRLDIAVGRTTTRPSTEAPGRANQPARRSLEVRPREL